MQKHFIILIACVSLACSNNKQVNINNKPNKQFELILSIEQKNTSPFLLDSTKRVLARRLVNAGYINASVKVSKDSTCFIILNDEVIDLRYTRNALIKPCKIEIYECYGRNEISNIIIDAKNESNALITPSVNNDLDTLLNMLKNIEGRHSGSDPIVATIDKAGKQKFENLYSAARPYLPKDARLVFEEISQSTLLKNKPGFLIYLFKDNTAVLEVHQYLQSVIEDTDEVGRTNITLQLNEEGKGKFSELTRKNIAHFLGVMIDDDVCFVPLVNEEIKEGKFVITGGDKLNSIGNGDMEELVNLMNSGFLPLSLLIQSVNIK